MSPGAWRRVWRRGLGSPTLALLVVAPVFGEVLSTSTAPLELMVPWVLLLQAALYGSGALLCRELARRHGLGGLGLVLLAAVYAVYEEALVTGFWFDRAYWARVGVGPYAQVWHTSLLLAPHLTVFHVTVSVCASVVVVERMFPAARDRPWMSRHGLVVAAVALLGLVPLLYGDAWRGPLPQELLAVAFGAGLIRGRLRRPAP